MIRQTYSHAILEISPEAFQEIKSELEKANYTWCFRDNNDIGIIIDMGGLALAEKKINQEEKRNN